MSTDTEYCCEVVRITELLPHNNADRLEIAHFETKDGPSAYTVVVQKGQFKVGDLAGYIGVDCLIPRMGPDPDKFEFLFERQESKGKDVHRVRAARLRGVYSEGLLIKIGLPKGACVDWDTAQAPLGLVLGSDISKLHGITYYERPVKNGPTAGSGIPSQSDVDRTLGGQFPIYTIDSLRKVPFLFGSQQTGGWPDEVEISEKIHGTNFRCGWIHTGWFGLPKWVLGSHRVVKAAPPGFLGRLWNRLTGKKVKTGWYDEDVWYQAALRHDLKKKLDTPEFHGLTFYFELYGVSETGARIQDLTYGDAELGLALIDIYDAESGQRMSKDYVRTAAKRLKMETVPVLYSGIYPGLEEVKKMAEGDSTLAPGQIREGVVVAGKFDGRRGKWVSEAYRMRKEQD